ncbi:MAG: hypothetical protein JWO38_2315 [Gemmataceae bacterium]|nr:hypothetical protein [Gemmataceae bacterium]
MQTLGDKVGEAAIWHNLGLMAWEIGRKTEAPKLVTVCSIIAQAIGTNEAVEAGITLMGMCNDLSYSQKHISEMLRSVVASYRQDRGAALLKAAFPDEA